jgi:hypothetical protein
MTTECRCEERGDDAISAPMRNLDAAIPILDLGPYLAGTPAADRRIAAERPEPMPPPKPPDERSMALTKKRHRSRPSNDSLLAGRSSQTLQDARLGMYVKISPSLSPELSSYDRAIGSCNLRPFFQTHLRT